MPAQQVAAGALWGALSAVCAFITDMTGIKVVRGDGACTNGKSVTLPRLPEGLLSFREVVKVIAYLYHECAHILYSDFTLKYTSPLHRGICGALEDIRIERLAMLNFPAARKYLSQLVTILTEEGGEGKSGFPLLKEEMGEAKVLQYYILYCLRHDVLRQTGIAPAMTSAVEVANKVFPSGMMIRLDAMMRQVENCESESDVFDLGAEIMKMIKDEQEKAKQPPPPPPPPQGGEDGKKGDDEQSGAGDDAEGDDQNNGASSAAAQGEEGSQNNGAPDPSGNSSSGQGSEQNDGAGEQSSAGAGGQGHGGSGSLDELMKMGEDDVLQSVGDMLGNDLNAMSAAKGASAPTVPNAYPLQLAEGAVDMVAIKGAVNATRTRTLAWLSSAAQCDLKLNRKGVMIDASQLAMAPLGGEIFAEEEDGIDINAAIHFVIDRSGSMSSLIKDATRAALAAALAYDVQGIESSVSVFPVYGQVDGATDAGVAVVKRWGEKPRALASRIGSLTASGSTPMAEAVMFAAADILRQPQTLKMIIVTTDGDPDDLAATQQAVAAARAAGIVVMGLGIGVDPSAVFGEAHAGQLNDIGELSGVMTRLVKAALKSKS